METLVKRLRLLIPVMVMIAFLAGLLYPTQVAAHGKELDITIASLIPDPDKPLVRLYRATIAYASDLEPVEAAKVELTAERAEGGEPVGPIQLTALKDQPGIYVGEVTYVRFGTWTVTLHVSETGGGETTFIDKVIPGGSTLAGDDLLAEQEERVRRLQLFFKFDWRDVGNILVRIFHSLAGVAYFALIGASLAISLIGQGTTRLRIITRLNRLFLPVAFTSLGMLLVSGLYSAAYDAPITWPGVFDLSGMQRLPFGYAYLAAFLLKPLILVALLVVALKMKKALSVMALSTTRSDDDILTDKSLWQQRFQRLAMVNAGLGLLVIADVAVVIYLHYISHLGIFLPY